MIEQAGYSDESGVTPPAIDALQKGDPADPASSTGTTPAELARRRERIRCPECNWEPRKSDEWYCDDCDWPEFFQGGCGMTWHTFDTRGVCPGCNHQWTWTSCLRCQGWSLHEDWYEIADE